MQLFPRALAAGLLGLGLAALPVAAQAAPTYPPGGGNSITVTSTSPSVGATVTVSAKTFQPDSDVEVTTVTEGGASGTARGGSLGGGRLSTAVVAAASGTCETGSTCTVVADSAGLATADVTVTKAGTTNVTFNGTGTDGSPLTQTVELEVLAASGEAGAPIDENLADTGAGNVLQAGVIALAMLAVGTVLVLAVRRRRDAVMTA